MGQSITITSSKPTRNGYTFLGWSTWSEATEPEIAFTPGYSYKSDYNFTLYAVWKEKWKPNLHFLSLMIVFLMELEQLKNW